MTRVVIIRCGQGLFCKLTHYFYNEQSWSMRWHFPPYSLSIMNTYSIPQSSLGINLQPNYGMIFLSSFCTTKRHKFYANKFFFPFLTYGMFGGRNKIFIMNEFQRTESQLHDLVAKWFKIRNKNEVLSLCFPSVNF